MSRMWQRTDFWPAPGGASSQADDYARGLADGRRTVETELAAERDALLQLIVGVEALTPPDAPAIAAMMVAAVERLVTDIVGQVPIDAARLRERATALAEHIAGAADPCLVLHPDDAALIDDMPCSTPVTTDPLVARGTVSVRSGHQQVDDGVDFALERLRAAIAAMGIAL